MLKNILPILIIVAIISVFVVGAWFLFGSSESDFANELARIADYSKEEINFLKEEGFLGNVGSKSLPASKDQASFLLKPGLIEQPLNNQNESFEILATKLDEDKYQMAFKLENKSNEKKDFYLIPISKNNQAEFQDIAGTINNKNKISFNKDNVLKDSLESLYNVGQHKKELTSELAKAYEDVSNKDYQAKPIKITLEPKSTLLGKSNWNIQGSNLEPIYLLVHGSAGGAKDSLSILTLHSHPQQGENWEVEFTTRGVGDLKIIPNDQATIDDDEFVGLWCGEEQRSPQILEGDVIYYKDWKCSGVGKVVHYTKKAGKHTLRFEFNDQIAFAYNSIPGVKTTINDSNFRLNSSSARIGGPPAEAGYDYTVDSSWSKEADTNVRDIAGAYNETVAKDIYCDDVVCILYTDGETPPAGGVNFNDSNLYASILWRKADVSSATWGPAESIAGGDIGGTHGTLSVGNDPDDVTGKNWLARDYSSEEGTYLAMDECKALGSGWRLPNILELDSIRDQGIGVAPYTYLPNIVSLNYWSSAEGSSTNSYNLYFGSGSVYRFSKSISNYVRCVRGD